MGKIGEYKGRIYLMVDGNILDKVLDKIKNIIGIEKFDDTKILIETDGKLPDDITIKNFVILITWIIKDDGNFYPQQFWEGTLYNE